MKNICLRIVETIVLILILCTHYTHAAVIESTTKGSIGKKSNNCKGIGLCLSSSASLNLLFSFDNSKNILSIQILESELTQYQPNTLPILKASRTFSVEEDIELPSSLVNTLHVDKIIQRGNYELTYLNGKFIIKIPISKT